MNWVTLQPYFLHWNYITISRIYLVLLCKHLMNSHSLAVSILYLG